MKLLYYNIKIKYLFIFIICRGKDPKSYNGPWAPPKTISKVRGEEMVAKRISNLALVDKGYLEDGPRRNASSDVMNIAQTCTLAIRRTPPIGISNRDASHKPVGKKEMQNIQGEAAATALNALQLLFWPH